MKLLINSSLILLIAVSLSVTAPSAFAKTNNNAFNIINHIFTFANTGSNTVNGKGTIITGGASAKSTAVNIVNTNNLPCCTTSVPEFGLIPGAIAAFVSAGTFFFLKKRYN